jgi:starvation-inducible DNA-binding protein
MQAKPHTTVPGLSESDARATCEQLEGRLVSLLDLHLTLKHIHWNVVGPNFLSVHEMLDMMVGPVREMTDTVAERIRTLGGIPLGTPQAIVDGRSWDDYPLKTESVYVHLKQLDTAFDGIIEDHRRALVTIGETEPISQDMLIDQTAKLEEFQWFVRSFFERSHEDDPSRPSSATRAADRRDSHVRGSADRAPTSEEAARAEEQESEVDVSSTEEHFERMSKVGAAIKGEGEI